MVKPKRDHVEKIVGDLRAALLSNRAAGATLFDASGAMLTMAALVLAGWPDESRGDVVREFCRQLPGTVESTLRLNERAGNA